MRKQAEENAQMAALQKVCWGLFQLLKDILFLAGALLLSSSLGVLHRSTNNPTVIIIHAAFVASLLHVSYRLGAA